MSIKFLFFKTSILQVKKLITSWKAPTHADEILNIAAT